MTLNINLYGRQKKASVGGNHYTVVCVQLPLILKQTLKTTYNLSRLVVYSSCLDLQRLFISL